MKITGNLMNHPMNRQAYQNRFKRQNALKGLFNSFRSQMSNTRPSQEKLFEESEEIGAKSEEGNDKARDDCVFCAIVSGRSPIRHIVFQDVTSLAFLDKRPVFLGHSLLIPRNHYETIHDLPKDLITPIFSKAQLLAQAVERGVHAEGTFIAINNRISQSVPHLHIHVIPRKSGDGLRGFFWPRQKYASEEQMKEIADSIKKSFDEIQNSQDH
jgi:histidine triad (HIT) family protein